MTSTVSLPSLSGLVGRLGLEALLCSSWGFGLTTATPLQRALCRVAEGRPLGELADRPEVVAAFGGTLPTVRPTELAILSGIRVGKSLLAAAVAVFASQTCDVSRLGPGEVPRVSVVSLTMDLASVIFDHIIGRMHASPVLSPLLLAEPVKGSVLVRHPSGRPVQIKVAAGARAGSSLVARWSAGLVFDEFPRMVGGDEAVVNWDDSRQAALLRLLPGAQMLHIGSPWAPFGPAYDLVTEHFGSPTKLLAVCKAPAWSMNPALWTPERCDEAKTADPDAYRTDVAAEFATPEESLFSSDLLAAAERPETGPEPGQTYSAAMDPATRGNAWTFGLFTRTGNRKRMVLARQWIGTREEPLSPRTVLREIALECRRYGVKTVESDQYSVDAIADLAREKEVGLNVVSMPLTEREKVERYLGIRAKLAEGEIELVPEVRADLLRLKRRPTQAGITIVLPLTSDGRHCDYAPTVMLGLGRYLRDVEPSQPTRDPEAERMLRAATKRYAPPRPRSW